MYVCISATIYWTNFYHLVESWGVFTTRKVQLWMGEGHRKSFLLVHTSAIGHSSNHRPQNLVHATKRASQHLLQGITHVWWRYASRPHVPNSHNVRRRKWDRPRSDWAHPGNRMEECGWISLAEKRCVGVRQLSCSAWPAELYRRQEDFGVLNSRISYVLSCVHELYSIHGIYALFQPISRHWSDFTRVYAAEKPFGSFRHFGNWVIRCTL